MRTPCRVAAFVSLSLLLACGSKDPPETPEDMAGASSDDLSGGGGTVDMTGGGGGELKLTGIWASRIVNAQIFDSMVLGKDTVTVTTLARVEITQSGLVVTGKNQVCDVSLTPFKGNQTVYPESALKAIPADTVTSMLSDSTLAVSTLHCQATMPSLRLKIDVVGSGGGDCRSAWARGEAGCPRRSQR